MAYAVYMKKKLQHHDKLTLSSEERELLVELLDHLQGEFIENDGSCHYCNKLDEHAADCLVLKLKAVT